MHVLSRSVVVVESPAKAKTINKYLGSDYTVLASYGHIRDLPSKNGSVNPDDEFSMLWEMDDRSKKHVDAIKKALKGADTLYLATDPDREGEAISWHVNQVLNDANLLKNTEVHRIVFHEITKKAVQASLEHPRPVNDELVEAYLARRALDYLVGFTLSPVLWRKLPGARSAGRVQSVALRIVVDREEEIERFNSQEYWSVTGAFETNKTGFEARLSYVNGEKVEKFTITTEAHATAVVNQLNTLSYAVKSIEKKQVKRNPAAPFITSTLQQEASRKLGFGASRTMQVAQRLYEGIDIGGETQGLISYMRTDSTNMAGEAIAEARQFLSEKFGDAYVPASPRAYKTKAKNAQEAHECIRPTRFTLTPDEVAPYLDEQQRKLYELIWKRALASQMETALFDQVSVDFADSTAKNIFRATGSTQVFDGFLRLYQEGVDEPSDDENARTLPKFTENQPVDLKDVIPNQHFTQPPPRFSEATLVKKLEELGIGRPSTYASLIQTLQDRQYVRLEKRQFIPEDRGRIVTSFLTHYFPKYVEYDFTAQLEEELDEISAGTKSWKAIMTAFWVDFKKNVEATTPLTISEVIDTLEADLAHFLFHGTADGDRTCPACKTGTMNLKLSKFGAFVGCSNYPECRHTRPLVGSDDQNGDGVDETREIGNDPNNGIPILLKRGPYGFYFEWQGIIPKPEPVIDPDAKPKRKSTAKPKEPKAPKPKRVSLPPTVAPADATLELAMQLAELPKVIGVHPEGGTISVGYGKFGPYVKFGDIFASIPKAMDFLAVTVEEAVDLITKKLARPPRAAGKGKPVKTAKASAIEGEENVTAKKTVAKKAPAKKAAVKKTPIKKVTAKK
ncbi:MAG: type I DNA topoisomerase [Pseudomonadota bacterium]